MESCWFEVSIEPLRRCFSFSLRNPSRRSVTFRRPLTDFFVRFDSSYINYSNIAANLLRRALKSELREQAARRDVTSIKFTKWANGKPESKF